VAYIRIVGIRKFSFFSQPSSEPISHANYPPIKKSMVNMLRDLQKMQEEIVMEQKREVVSRFALDGVSKACMQQSTFVMVFNAVVQETAH
jgi:hypothetical protein